MNQPTTERRTRVRTQGPACTADLCQQACELPGADADPLREDPAPAFELVGVVLVVAALAGVLLFTVNACDSA